ncbi:hypothetical protein M0805_006461 [Coniferiporia weirii]|nr:hypothetical protein M0805_006461 [Coniferiporia weirii]
MQAVLRAGEVTPMTMIDQTLLSSIRFKPAQCPSDSNTNRYKTRSGVRDVAHGSTSPGCSNLPSVEPVQSDAELSPLAPGDAALPSGSSTCLDDHELIQAADESTPNVPVFLRTEVTKSKLNDVPVRSSCLGEPYTYQGDDIIKGNVLGSVQTVKVDRFEDKYLRKSKASQAAKWKKLRAGFLKNLQGAAGERQTYTLIIKLLTKICLLVCKGKDRCLAFYDTAETGCFSNFKGSGLRPDIIAKWTTQENAAKIAQEKPNESKIYWHEIQSLVEVRQKFKGCPASDQTGEYLHILPRELPSLAAMLYLAWDVPNFCIYWSDTSGIARSNHYNIREKGSWDVLFQYVLTVTNPLERLPQRDPTMMINVENPFEPEWFITCKSRNYLASLLWATSHQICVNEKDVMHCDVSRNNILINPVHYDTKLDDIPKAKYIHQILNPAEKNLKEEGALIDWDNAADLEEDIEGDSLTDQTGTPMFVSISVGTGTIRDETYRGKFPRLKGETKHLYVQAFGQEKYDEYIEAVKRTTKYLSLDEKDEPRYKHSPFHDVESFFWVLVHELLLAWPEGEEECLSLNAFSLIIQFQEHTFSEDGCDFRFSILSKKKRFFEGVLHPRLWCLAEVLADMAAYLRPEWAFWPSLPKDHVHEAFKRLLFVTARILNLIRYPNARR